MRRYKDKRIVPYGWNEILIGKAFETMSGGTPKSTNKEYFDGGDIPWINSGELSQSVLETTSNYITPKGLANSSARIVPVDSVLVAMYGATAGKASLLKIEACTNQAICAILPNEKYYQPFVKYSLDNMYEYLISLSSGSARDNLSQEGICEIPLMFPTIKEQKQRCYLLECIDNKIRLNTRINRALESMAKQLYDYWFVQFDFPDENGKPYKSSGGKMVWNEKLKREIPEGWENGILSDFVIQRLENVNPGESIKNLPYTPIDIIPQRRMSFGKALSYKDAQSSLIHYMKNDILLCAMRVYFHKVCIAPFEGITRSTTMVMTPKNKENYSFVYQLINEDSTIQYATKNLVGTQMRSEEHTSELQS